MDKKKRITQTKKSSDFFNRKGLKEIKLSENSKPIVAQLLKVCDKKGVVVEFKATGTTSTVKWNKLNKKLVIYYDRENPNETISHEAFHAQMLVGKNYPLDARIVKSVSHSYLNHQSLAALPNLIQHAMFYPHLQRQALPFTHLGGSTAKELKTEDFKFGELTSAGQDPHSVAFNTCIIVFDFLTLVVGSSKVAVTLWVPLDKLRSCTSKEYLPFLESSLFPATVHSMVILSLSIGSTKKAPGLFT